MSTQIPVETASGEVFYVQAEIEGPVASAGGDDSLIPKGAAMKGAADRVLKRTVFSKAVGVIRGLTQDVSAGLMAADPRPDQVELEFSLGLGASGSVMIFKGDAQASFKLKLTWKAP